MALALRRIDYRRLANARAKDAVALLVSKRYTAAYYFAGFAIECAIKSSIASKTGRFHYPPTARTINDGGYYAHNLEQLISTANLRAALNAEIVANPQFEARWNTVKQWKNDVRYESITRQLAIGMVHAVTDVPDGVLAWLRAHWNS
jgi:HEPN domain-containing protein